MGGEGRRWWVHSGALERLSPRVRLLSIQRQLQRLRRRLRLRGARWPWRRVRRQCRLQRLRRERWLRGWGCVGPLVWLLPLLLVWMLMPLQLVLRIRGRWRMQGFRLLWRCKMRLRR